MNHGSDKDTTDHPSHLKRDDEEDRILAAQAQLQASAQADGKTPAEASSASQQVVLSEWAQREALLLDKKDFERDLIRGGQEHDIILREETCLKVTREGYFGLAPGIDLALVSSDQDARRFHLWEATPYEYLERLRLQNLITPSLNTLEGFIIEGDDMAIVISQPRFELNAVTQDEIDKWFGHQGFRQVTKSAYYRESDNLAVFDAHDKNLVRSSIAPKTLIPFDVIPLHPAGGFLDFIQDTLSANHSLKAIRTAQTTSRSILHE